MKKFAVIGNPVQHSLSPLMHNWVFNKLNLKAQYIKIKLDSNDLSNIVHELRNGLLDGINITLPYKEEIIPMVDTINQRAKHISSINCISIIKNKLIGNNTDWYGFSQSLKRHEVDVATKDIIILGYGGTAKSIIFALRQLGANKIYVFNRNIENKNVLLNNDIYRLSLDDLNSYIKDESIIINTTPVGMKDNNSLIDKKIINNKQILIDVIYNPLNTTMLKMGIEVGAKTINGLDMFIYQGLASLDLWFGKSISKQVNFNEIKSYIEKNINAN